MNPKLKGNLAMAVSKTFSGLNQNALKYLVPVWMSPLCGALLRLGFGAVVFWVIGFFKKPKVKPTWAQRLGLLGLGAVFMFSFMFFLLIGLKYTTPITSSIFISLQPATVFVICAIFMHERVTSTKVLGIAIGLAGALVCILTQHTSATATRPLLGCLYSELSCLTYSAFLVLSGLFLKKLDSITVSKWSFLGGAVSTAVAVWIVGWDAPVVTHLWSMAGIALLYILVFPTCVSYFLLDIGLRYLPDTVVALYGNLILIVSSVASYILGQDTFSWWQILAIILMIVSVYLVEAAERRPTPATKS